MSDIHVVILAAGKGTRMKSAHPKVLHRAGGLRLIDHVLRTAASLQPASTVVVVGHQAERIKQEIGGRPGLHFATQEPQLGTGHALLQAEPWLAGASGTVVLLSGDAPLVRPETLKRLVQTHEERGAAATVLTARVSGPHEYGRILREQGRLTGIVEHKDATAEQRAIDEINSSIYAFALAPLFAALRSIGSANAQGEYYLPDLIGIYRSQGRPVEAMLLEDAREVLGVNSQKELADVTTMLKTARNDALMASGVSLIDPATAWIGPDVEVGPDTIIHPNVYLEGRTRIGANCEIHAGSRIVDSIVEDGAVINNYCVITESVVKAGARVGPFAHVRPQSEIGEQAHVGNFTELKKTKLGKGSKANHLSYLGDAVIGDRVNVGAGTITCNYDGTHKHQTIIEDGAFIGSDSQLVAPVRVGKGAYVAAGSSIVEDVPPGALGIARGKQINKAGWVDKKKG